MFVQEEKIFAGKVLRLQVCTMEGAEWLEEVPEDTTVEKLKERCLKHVRSADRAEIGAKITAWEGRAGPARGAASGSAVRGCGSGLEAAEGQRRRQRKAASGGVPSGTAACFVSLRWRTTRQRSAGGGNFPFWKKRPQRPALCWNSGFG